MKTIKTVPIEIDGVSYPVCFNLNALREIERASGKTIGEIEAYASSIDGLVTIARIGLNNGARVSGKKEEFTADKVGDLFDLEGLTEIVNAISEFLPDQKKTKANPAPKMEIAKD